jgi:uncharacterized membrane protein
VIGRPFAIGAAAIGSGLLGGVLFAFSSFVMPALRRIPPEEGISAMQSINRQAPTFAFGSLIAATALLASGVGLHAVLNRDQPGAGWTGIGTISIVLALAITGAYNVPRNNRLASFEATTPEAARYWSTFLAEWIIANHLRTAFCTIAAASYVIALRQPT